MEQLMKEVGKALGSASRAHLGLGGISKALDRPQICDAHKILNTNAVVLLSHSLISRFWKVADSNCICVVQMEVPLMA